MSEDAAAVDGNKRGVFKSYAELCSCMHSMIDWGMIDGSSTLDRVTGKEGWTTVLRGHGRGNTDKITTVNFCPHCGTPNFVVIGADEDNPREKDLVEKRDEGMETRNAGDARSDTLGTTNGQDDEADSDPGGG